MKIAIVHQPSGPIWTPGTSGSVSIWVYEVASCMARSHETLVYAKRGRRDRLQPAIEHYNKVQYRRVSVTADENLLKILRPFNNFRDKNRPFFVSPFGYLKYISAIAYDLRRQHCDIIHVVGFPHFIPMLHAFNPGVPIVLHMHGEWLTQFDSRLVKKWLRHADLVLSISETITGKIKASFPDLSSRCHTVPMGVDIERFSPEDHETSTDRNNSIQILYVGRISPEKGLHVLLDAFQRVVVKYPNAELKIVGPEWLMPKDYIVSLSGDPEIVALSRFYNGSYLTHLRKLVQPSNMNHVTFVDLVVHEKISSYYRDAEIYVNPSFTEGLPMSIIEAMASGLPVVATKVGGVGELVDQGKTGILVDRGSSASLAEAMLCVLADESLRKSMGKAAREKAVDRFSWRRITENLLTLYQTCLCK